MYLLRRMLRGLITFLVGAGLLAVVYTTPRDAPVGSATSPAQQPATPGHFLPSTATTRPILTDPAPDAFGVDALKPPSSDLDKATIRPKKGAKRADADIPRAELARKPRSVGWGDSYTVRLLTSSGRPLIVSQIVLIAHMADGTVETVSMGALPERGIYRATVPTRRSTPVNLQVRAAYGEQRFEIPVRR